MTQSVAEAAGSETRLPVVLLVDDDRTTLEVFKRVLERAGYAVVTLQNSDEALQKFEDTKPDVVVLDLIMPRRNGAQVLADIRARDPLVAVLMMTSNSNEHAMIEAVHNGADGYILKPFYIEEIVKAVTRVYERAALRQDNADLTLKLDESRRSFNDQLRAAATIQSGMLPHWLQPDAAASTFVPLGFNLGYSRISPRFTVGVAYEPAFVVAGDFYNAVESRNGSTVLFIGDVSNKGLPAALFMSVAQVVLTMEFKRSPTLVEALDWANHHLYPSLSTADMFVTLFAVSVRPGGKLLRYVDAGHGHAFIRRKSGAYESMSLTTGGLPLGIMPDTKYSYGELTLDPGDMLAIYSDGLVDTPNAAGETFGTHRLQQSLETAIADAPPPGDGEGTAQIVRNILTYLHLFASPDSHVPTDILADDRTLLLVQAT